MKQLTIGERLALSTLAEFVFHGPRGRAVTLLDSLRGPIESSHRAFLTLFEERQPIYGVTTGFGDSCSRPIGLEQSEELQANLIRYLSCGSGKLLAKPVRRATCLFRLLSLSRGLSGVSLELIEQLRRFVEADWLPLIPAEGSLGASGDLIPLAHMTQMLQGEGAIETPSGIRAAAEVLHEAGVKPYRLKPKEGLALVNGTSAMAAQCFVNLAEARQLFALSHLETAWLCLAVAGRSEAFGQLVNDRAKRFSGQKDSAAAILKLIEKEGGTAGRREGQWGPGESYTQDRYSLRCAPQILGPCVETMRLAEEWLLEEINGVSDNPLVSGDGEMASGGNFYGGYLSHGMDYLKIGLAHACDLLDRQLTLLIDEKASRGLPPNLANWPGMAPEQRFLHHGLKGLHQATSALTSDVLSRAIPAGIFSRSSESHNQDKVSLGMTAALQCEAQLDIVFRVHAMALLCLAQALDLRQIRLKGDESSFWYEKIRNIQPFVDRDQPLDKAVARLSEALKEAAHQGVQDGPSI